MRYAFDSSVSRAICIALATGGLATIACPALAQSVEEITVMGRYGPDGKVAELSRPVSYADLDLTTKSGVDMLKMRVKDTAKELCTELGETSTVSTVVPSCQQQARIDAMKQVRTALALAQPKMDLAWTETWSDMPAATGAGYAADVSTTVATPPATYTTKLVTNGPVADTSENRALYGAPLSRAGKRTAPAGN